MIVYCRTVDCRKYSITLPKTCTIRELKELLWSKTEEDMDTFRLAFNGVALNDLDDRLAQWRIIDGSTVYIFKKIITSPGVPKKEGSICDQK